MDKPHPPSNLLNTPPSVEDVSLLDVALLFARHWRAFLLGPLLAGTVGFGLSLLIEPVYTSTVKLMPPQQQSSAASLLGSLGGIAGIVGSGAIPGLKNPADQWIGLLKSRTVADALIDRFQLMKLYDSEYRFQARDALDGDTRITAGKDGLINIEVDNRSPKLAAQLADGYVSELQKLSKSLAMSEAAQRRVFFEKQLAETKNKLIQAEVVLKQSGVGPGVLKTSPSAAVAVIAQLQAQVTAAEVKVSAMRSAMTSDNPELQMSLAELRSLRDQLAKVQQNDVTGGTGAGADYVPRYREFKYQETLFELLARQYELARADEAREGALIQVVDKAQVPEWKSKPKRGLIAVLSAVAGFVLVFLYAAVAGTIRFYREDPRNARKLQALGQVGRR